ncbi:MAG: tRNA (5-methylaminomethyl-2-thiouridine)(34)-methyltransferase MnmD [Marinilabiliaceae bacterium]|nr:tRNA (5-methylaminomethyl-2-thiouridine)(34)-methyltransferase MnmD [Marinilabiliaceae bacterium]
MPKNNALPFALEIILTEEGTTTLYRSDIEEHYHSIYGAVQESMHVFIVAGLKQICAKRLKILEIGFGTGLNVLLTMLNADNKTIEYHAIEKYPLNEDIIEKINYPKYLLGIDNEKWYKKIHENKWNHNYHVEPWFFLKKIHADILDYHFETKYDLVYFDAFAPNKQPELWDIEIFKKIYDSMNENAILTTYCSKGAVRRAMIQAGFNVEKVPGPNKKREMLVSKKVQIA